MRSNIQPVRVSFCSRTTPLTTGQFIVVCSSLGGWYLAQYMCFMCVCVNLCAILVGLLIFVGGRGGGEDH